MAIMILLISKTHLSAAMINKEPTSGVAKAIAV